MRYLKTIRPEFVEYIPSEGKDLLPGIVYISMKHRTVVHRCPCGCGGLSEFVLDPIRFRMEYDGDSVSFSPSVGNSNLLCRSHYWIRENEIQWCSPMGVRATKEAQRRELATAVGTRTAEQDRRKGIIGQLWNRFVKCLKA